MSSTLGTRYYRSLSAKEKATYDRMSGPEKKKIGKEWGMKQYTDYKATREHLKEEEEVEKIWGEFLNFDAILRAEGGRKSSAAIQGTINYCKAA
eukprot:9468406-Pyramimonas_sp.AAC.2